MGRLRPQQKPLGELQKQVDGWNKRHLIGSHVRFHPVIGEPEYRLRATAGEAFVLSGHTACVFLEGERGCVALDACEPVGGND